MFEFPETPGEIYNIQNCQNPNSTSTEVGFDTKMTFHTISTAETQCSPPGATDEPLLTKTKYKRIRNNE